ncbi:MAG: class I SAM-dependent methyltransferase [Flavobacteriales bacterium]
MSGSATHKQCIGCNSTALNTVNGYHKVALLKCTDCSLVFCTAIPTTQELTEYYKHYGKTDFISAITTKRYNTWLDEFEKFRHTNNLLDIGCGNGFFLSEAKKRRWNVYGTEFSNALVQGCVDNGINMHEGVLTEETFGGVIFDVVTSIEVIEHINNPLDEMQMVNGMLRSGGLFYCTTPNWNALSRFWLKDQYNIIAYPEHLAYFTPRSLNKLMKRCGFEKLKTETTGISITRFNQSTGRKKQAVVSVSSDDEVLRNKLETKWYLKLIKKLMNAVFKFTGTGYSLKGWYVNK